MTRFLLTVYAALCLSACSGYDDSSVANEGQRALDDSALPDCHVAETTEALPGESYAFMTAGHVYGSPLQPAHGLHPPLMNSVDRINAQAVIEFGVLTGDIVFESDDASWQAARADISKFDFPIHTVPGNHDRGELFEKFYGGGSWSFTLHNDLFIGLDSAGWGIYGEQLEHLKAELMKADDYRHIFIFHHELLWWTPYNRFSKTQVNSRKNFPGSSNFWSAIAPMLIALDNKVFLFAGDLGAFEDNDAFSHSSYCNLTFVASGMGGGKQDNVAITRVSPEGNVAIDRIDLQSIPE